MVIWRDNETTMLLDHVEQIRRDISPRISQTRKSQLGQFMTPAPVARFMADMFPPSAVETCKLLDAGAGLGALTSAFLDRWKGGGFGFTRVESTTHELDDTLRVHLEEALSKHAAAPRFVPRVVAGDFIIETVLALLEDRAQRNFTHAILNPPYKKINSGTQHRRALSQVGIETVNLYSAFVALAIELMAHGGIIVAIIPRSFCNGTYYRPFRELLLSKAALRAMHLFDSRSKAFGEDDVLQENVIIMLERGGVQGAVTVTTSTDAGFADLATLVHPFERIVFPGDAERFIHVPTSGDETELELSGAARFTLDQIGVRVSTGPIVDFRLKEHLRAMPEEGSVPILYPTHFAGKEVVWPIPDSKKANAIMLNDETRGWLMPNGFYCVVRRFSSKEERRRIVANVIRPDDFPEGTEALGLENHVNVFNEKRRGLPELMAYGLTAYLNTSAMDEAFRRFSGHTQVNAGDLKTMRYPSREVLMEFGRWARQYPQADQSAIDQKFQQLSS
jgi:adenine-specific DNA-methyltransferase